MHLRWTIHFPENYSLITDTRYLETWIDIEVSLYPIQADLVLRAFEDKTIVTGMSSIQLATR